MDLSRNGRLKELELQNIIETTRALDLSFSSNISRKEYIQCAVRYLI